MSTLIERLPTFHRSEDERERPMTTKGGAGAHRLESPPPSPGAELPTPEEDVTTQEKRKVSKGKAVDSRERGGSSTSSGDVEGDDAEEDGREASKRYPPMNDDDVEAKRVEENLRHMELMEKQRRKAARDSRTARTPSSIVSDVTSFVTTFGGVRRDSKQSIRSGGWLPAKTRDSAEVEVSAALKLNRTSTESEGKKKSTSAFSDDANPFSDSPRPPSIISSPPEEPPSTSHSRETSTSSPSSPVNPFKNPLYESTPAKDLNVPLLDVSPAASPRSSLLQVPAPVIKKKKAKSGPKTAPPLVRPLDLPEPRMPKMDQLKPGTGHWRRVMEARELEEMAEEEERERRNGRWWTDWVCGCREGPRREEQDGRTNPFE